MHIVYVDNIPILPSNSPQLYLSAHPILHPPFFIGYAAHLFISVGVIHWKVANLFPLPEKSSAGTSSSARSPSACESLPMPQC